ncbi:FecR domain-containing protein [Paenibacillus gansuensis]|uniref:FecR domain-containing protein n=1 Tax=Paenibacillus gansuensis TaxID=306542 RepID=A0ABW5PE75_9BACL
MKVWTRPYSLLLAAVLLLHMLSMTLLPAAEAKTSRAAKIVELSGTVKVKKAGGSRGFSAFRNMTLNQGDQVSVGAKSSLTLQIGDRTGDVMTFAENSSFYVSDLKNSAAGGKKSKLKLISGSVYSSVSKLNGDDEFQIETPTAVMGVRGTHFVVVVNPMTGVVSTVVMSGVVKSTSIQNISTGAGNAQQSNTVHLYPAQQIQLDTRTGTGPIEARVEVVNIGQLIGNSSPDVIKAMISNAASIQKENEAFIEQMMRTLEQGGKKLEEKSALVFASQDDLSNIAANLNNLIGNAAKEALNQKKIEKNLLDKLIEEANKSIGNPAQKIDVTKVKPLDPQAGLDKALEKEREAIKKEKPAYLDEEQLIKENRERLERLLRQLIESQKTLEEANRAKLEAELKNAQERFLAQLTESEKAKFKENKKNNQGNPSNGNSGSGNSNPPSGKGIVKAVPSKSSVKAGESFTVSVLLDRITDLYGLELHLSYGPGIGLDAQAGAELGTGTIFNKDRSVESFKEVKGTSANEARNEFVYVISHYGNVQGVSVNSEQVLAVIPMKASADLTNINIEVEAKAVKGDGSLFSLDK